MFRNTINAVLIEKNLPQTIHVVNWRSFWTQHRFTWLPPNGAPPWKDLHSCRSRALALRIHIWGPFPTCMSTPSLLADFLADFLRRQGNCSRRMNTIRNFVKKVPHMGYTAFFVGWCWWRMYWRDHRWLEHWRGLTTHKPWRFWALGIGWLYHCSII